MPIAAPRSAGRGAESKALLPQAAPTKRPASDDDVVEYVDFDEATRRHGIRGDPHVLWRWCRIAARMVMHDEIGRAHV